MEKKTKTDTFIEKIIPIINQIFGIDILQKIEEGVARYRRDDHKAVNTGITARVEEKLKTIICPRIPNWMSSDMLSLIGMIGMVITALGYLYGPHNRWYLSLVIIGMIINWFGDSFDGSIARYRNRTRPNYGYYIDHFLDAVALFILGLGMGYSAYIKLEYALFFVILYLIITEHVLLVNYVQRVFKYSIGAFGPTEVRIVACIVAIYQFFSPIHSYTYKGLSFTQYDVAIMFINVCMLLMIITSSYQKARELHKLDVAKWEKK